MTIATFGALKTQVRSFFNDRSDIPTIVYDLAAAELNSRLNLRIMQSTSTLSAVAATETVALPADFLRVVHAYVDRDPRMVLDAADEFSKNVDYRASGIPTTYTIAGSNMLLNPVPDGAYSIELRYIAKLSDFSADADTNTVLTTHPALYLYASLKHVAAWEQDIEAAQAYATMLETELERVQKQDRDSRFGTGPLRSRADHHP